MMMMLCGGGKGKVHPHPLGQRRRRPPFGLARGHSTSEPRPLAKCSPARFEQDASGGRVAKFANRWEKGDTAALPACLLPRCPRTFPTEKETTSGCSGGRLAQPRSLAATTDTRVRPCAACIRIRRPLPIRDSSTQTRTRRRGARSDRGLELPPTIITQPLVALPINADL